MMTRSNNLAYAQGFFFKGMLKIITILALFIIAPAMIPNEAWAQAEGEPCGGFTQDQCNPGLVCEGSPVGPVCVTPEIPFLDLDTCANNPNPSQYTVKVVDCVRAAIINAMVKILDEISKYMAGTVGMIFVFSVCLFGIRIGTGEKELLPKAVGFLIRMGLVWAFSYNLAGLAKDVFGVMDELIRWVVGPYTPWGKIDSYLGKFFGFATDFALFQGLVGIIGASLFSSTVGVIMFMSAIMAIFKMLSLVFDVVYTYLMAIMVIALLLILSPIIIPLAMFHYTERYFKKWLDILIASILVPVLLFAFLSIFLNITDELITNIFVVLGDNGNHDFRAFWKMNCSKISWLMPTDPNYARMFEQALLGVSSEDLRNIPAVQLNIDPFNKEALNVMPSTFPCIDFGPENAKIMQSVIFCFAALWIVSSVKKSILAQIPPVAESIASAVSGVTIQSVSFKHTLHQAKENLKIGAGAAAGAGIGGAAGGAFSEQGRGVGGTFGGIFGALLGRRL